MTKMILATVTSPEKVVRVWQIGPDGTEYYAAHSLEELRQFYVEMVGEEQTKEDFADYLEEVSAGELDAEFEFDTEGIKVMTTWRKLAEDCRDLPAQISTGYN